MINHVNGWNFIEKYLIRYKIKQRELAMILNISPSAISQVKCGKFLLSEEHLNNIADLFEFDQQQLKIFQTSIMIARFDRKRHKNRNTIAPLYNLSIITYEALRNFKLEMGNFEDYLELNMCGSKKYLHNPHEFGVLACSSLIDFHFSSKILFVLLNGKVYSEMAVLAKNRYGALEIIKGSEVNSEHSWAFTIVKIMPQLNM